MAMSVVTTERIHGAVKEIVFSWTSASDGTATGTTTYAYDGKVELLTTDPGATAPSDNYDVTLTDSDGVDVLGGAGVDRDTANTEQKVASLLGAVASSKLTLNIANAGDSKVGVTYVHIR